MTRTDAWREVLTRYRWPDLYLAGEGFARFLEEEQARAAQAPDPRGMRPADRPGTVWTSGMWFLRNRIRLVVLLGVAVLLALGLVAWQRTAAARREHELAHRLEEVEAQYRKRSAETEDLLHGLSDQIERQLDKWGLTAAEREVAWLMLKGLQHKEIASMRGTSERTVRQQALAVYKKAGLDGRTDLAAFFLEDLLPPPAVHAGRHTA